MIMIILPVSIWGNIKCFLNEKLHIFFLNLVLRGPTCTATAVAVVSPGHDRLVLKSEFLFPLYRLTPNSIGPILSFYLPRSGREAIESYHYLVMVMPIHYIRQQELWSGDAVVTKVTSPLNMSCSRVYSDAAG